MIVQAQQPSLAIENIAKAAALLKAGELVGFPTETVYGLGADACNEAAVAKVFAAKGRPSDHPLIVHVTDAAQAGEFADAIAPFAARLMQAFWPGPLSLILPRRAGVAAAAAGGQASVGLRCPSHPVAQALLQAARDAGVAGVAAPSANRFGRVSPTTALHVQEELGAGLFILDGGACPVGIESTIIDCTRAAPVLLRPGMLDLAAIESACGTRVQSAHEAAGAAPRASRAARAAWPRPRTRRAPGGTNPSSPAGQSSGTARPPPCPSATARP